MIAINQNTSSSSWIRVVSDPAETESITQQMLHTLTYQIISIVKL